MSKKPIPISDKKIESTKPISPQYTFLKRLNKILNFLFIGSIFLLIAAEATFKINDPDVMHYLASGREIMTHGLSDMCVFNYTNHVCQTVFLHEWLFHLMVYTVYTFGSWNGLAIFQACIDVTIFILLFIYSRRAKSSIFSTGLFLLFAALIASERFMLRADAFGLLMFVVFYILVSEYIKKRIYEKKALIKVSFLACIGATTALWANTHGSFPLSLVILMAFVGADILKLAWNKIIDQSTYDETSELKQLAILLAVTVGAVFINPFGYKAVYGAFDFFFNGYAQTLQTQNMEWRSPFRPQDFVPPLILFFEILIAITLSVILLRIKKIRLSDLLLFAPILYISISYVRNLALFSIASVLIFPGYVDKMDDFIHDTVGKKWKPISLVLQSIVIIFLIYFSLGMANSNLTNGINFFGVRSREFGLGISEIDFPIGAVQFIKQNNIHGNVFNDYSSGTYLNWTLYPTQKTFIDADTFSLDSLLNYNRVVDGEIPYDQIVKKYKINYFFFRYTGIDSTPLISRMYKDKNWKLVYLDEMSAIFVANNKENENLIDKYGIDFATGRNFDKDHLKSIKENINLSTGFSNRGLFLSNIGLDKDALYQFTKAVSLNKNDYSSLTNLGAAYFQLGDDNQAAKQYEASIAIQPNFAPAHFNLGLIYQKLQKNADAMIQFKRALSINRAYKFANFSLGTLYEAKGDRETAKNYYQLELTVDPKSNDARDALVRLEGGIVPTKEPSNPNDIPAEVLRQQAQSKNGQTQPGQTQPGQVSDTILLQAQLKKTPNDPNLHFQLGIAYGKAGDLTKAIEELKKAISLKPDMSIAHYNLGYAYDLQKQKDLALAEYELAKKYDPSFSNTYLNLANIYEGKGLYDKALEALETFLKLDPKSTQAEKVKQEISSIKAQLNIK